MKVFNRAVKLSGETHKIDGKTVSVLQFDQNGKVLFATGLTVPTGAGYAKGALFIKTDAASGTKGLYENQGTTAVASFNLIGSITAASEIANGVISLENLDAGITPSHLVKFAGKVTWSGSGATCAATVTGVAATDIVIATIQTKPTQAAYLVGAVPSTNTVTFELSAANTSNNAVISYIVLNAAA